MYSKENLDNTESHDENLVRLNKELDAKNKEILDRLVC